MINDSEKFLIKKLFDNGENFSGVQNLGIFQKPQGFPRFLNGINEFSLFDNEKIV